jgi:membrane-bound serine protease (ClpP class)
MTTSMEFFWILLLGGLMLLGAEVFVPGGILGAFGMLALVGACAVGFLAFPGYGPPVAVGIVVLAGLALVVWIRMFPRSGLGRRMTVSRDLRDAKATADGLGGLVGAEGQAVSDLRPSGFALIGGRRLDVITQGGMISKGTAVRVVLVEGNRVVVRAAGSPTAAAAPQSGS